MVINVAGKIKVKKENINLENNMKKIRQLILRKLNATPKLLNIWANKTIDKYYADSLINSFDKIILKINNMKYEKKLEEFNKAVENQKNNGNPYYPDWDNIKQWHKEAVNALIEDLEVWGDKNELISGYIPTEALLYHLKKLKKDL